MNRSADVTGNALLTAAHERCLAVMLSRPFYGKPAPSEKVKFAVHLIADNIRVRGWTVEHSHLVFTGNAPEIKAAVPGESVAVTTAGISIPRRLDPPVMFGTSIF